MENEKYGKTGNKCKSIFPFSTRRQSGSECFFCNLVETAIIRKCPEKTVSLHCHSERSEAAPANCGLQKMLRAAQHDGKTFWAIPDHNFN